MFTDRFVCICDGDNPLAKAGRIGLDDFGLQRHAVANFGPGNLTLADRALLERNIQVRAATTVHGLLPLPFVVAGTDLIAFVLERLVRRCAATLGLAVVDVDWDPPQLIEAAHWHPGRGSDPALHWLRGVLREVSALVESPPPT